MKDSMKTAPLAVLIVVLLAGCASSGGCNANGCMESLELRDTDDGWDTTGKVLSRTLIGVTTLGLSEARLSYLKKERAREEARRWQAEYEASRQAERRQKIEQEIEAVNQREKDQRLTKWQAIAKRTEIACRQKNYNYCTALPSLALMLDEKMRSGELTDAEAQYRYDQALVEMETRNVADEQRRRAEFLQMMPLLMQPPPPVYVPPPIPMMVPPPVMMVPPPVMTLPPPPVSCTSTKIGQSIYTNCR